MDSSFWSHTIDMRGRYIVYFEGLQVILVKNLQFSLKIVFVFFLTNTVYMYPDEMPHYLNLQCLPRLHLGASSI